MPAVERARVAPLRYHDLRHTCAALHIAQGAHPLSIKQRLGHRDIQTTMNIYGHLFPEGETAMTDRLDVLLRRSLADSPRTGDSAEVVPLIGSEAR